MTNIQHQDEGKQSRSDQAKKCELFLLLLILIDFNYDHFCFTILCDNE